MELYARPTQALTHVVLRRIVVGQSTPAIHLRHYYVGREHTLLRTLHRRRARRECVFQIVPAHVSVEKG